MARAELTSTATSKEIHHGCSANLTDAAALNASFDKEFVKNFQGESDRLAEILGSSPWRSSLLAPPSRC